MYNVSVDMYATKSEDPMQYQEQTYVLIRGFVRESCCQQPLSVQTFEEATEV
jgi:hypothetical protein